MTDANGEILVSAKNGSDPDVECEADVDVKFDKNSWTYVKIRVRYEFLGFDGWKKYRVLMYFCEVGQPTLLLEFYDVYIYGKKGMELMTNFIFLVKETVKNSCGILAAGGIKVFYEVMKTLCVALRKNVKLFNSNYHRAVASKLGEEEVEIG